VAAGLDAELVGGDALGFDDDVETPRAGDALADGDLLEVLVRREL
jgi:hypothetical protein